MEPQVKLEVFDYTKEIKNNTKFYPSMPFLTKKNN